MSTLLDTELNLYERISKEVLVVLFLKILFKLNLIQNVIYKRCIYTIYVAKSKK